MKSRTNKRKWISRTIHIPGILWPWVEAEAARPRYAGNVSAYFRALILDAYEEAHPGADGADLQPNGTTPPGN